MFTQKQSVSRSFRAESQKAIEESGPMQPGDIIITNDPYTTDGLATHLPDVHIIKPIFIEDEIVSYLMVFCSCK